MEKILACLSPSPSNPKILRAAAAMARDGAELTALFIETPQYPRLAAADRRRLQENIQIAEQLGAKIQTVSGDDVAFQIAETRDCPTSKKWCSARAISSRPFSPPRRACRTGWRNTCPTRRSM